jgi:saccharopine dehydrogenase (NAD+, L-lysine forming)
MTRLVRKWSVVVLGGYGAVGRYACEELGRVFDGRIIIGGRDIQRGRLLARRLGERFEAVQVDVTEPSTYEDLLPRAAAVINCVEHDNFAIAKHCVASSAHYIDVSATAEILRRLQTLAPAARRTNATVLLSVGVAPGLTNLLAHHARSRLGLLERVDIFVLLGLREAHGEAAIRWTLKQFGEKFTTDSKGAGREVEPFREGLATRMPEPFGERTAYRFDFSDQHTLPATLGTRDVSTWLCFDSRAATRVLRLIGSSRLLRVLPLWRWSGAVARLVHRFAVGGTQFAVQVDAVAIAGGRGSFALVGDGEARTTGLVAANSAGHLLSSAVPSGVLHIEQLMDLDTLLSALGDSLALTETTPESMA